MVCKLQTPDLEAGKTLSNFAPQFNIRGSRKTYRVGTVFAMKKILLSLTLVAMTLIPFACNNVAEKDAPAPQKATQIEKSTAQNAPSENALDVARSFYKNAEISIGRQVETIDENQNQYLVSEILVQGGNARGYLVTNQNDGAPVYFADVDRANFTLTTIDIAHNETLVVNDINQLDEYSSTNEFDFIDVIGSYNGAPEYQNEPTPFWGSTGPHCGNCVLGVQNCATRHYAFWIKVKTTFSNVSC